MIVDDEAPARGQCHRAVDREQAFRVQPIVVIQPAPSLTVVAIGDIELGARVAHRRVGAREGHARLDELIVPEEAQTVGKRLLVHHVSADNGGQAAGHLRDRLRLARVQPGR